MFRRSQLRLPALLLLLSLAGAGCRSVAFHEKRDLSDPLLALEENGAHVHFRQKVFYSMEGSAGGIGSGAGGGCGCY